MPGPGVGPGGGTRLRASCDPPRGAGSWGFSIGGIGTAGSRPRAARAGFRDHTGLEPGRQRRSEPGHGAPGPRPSPHHCPAGGARPGRLTHQLLRFSVQGGATQHRLREVDGNELGARGGEADPPPENPQGAAAQGAAVPQVSAGCGLRVCVCALVCMHVYMCVCVHLCVCMRVCTGMHVSVHVRAHVHFVHVYVCACMCSLVCVCMCVYMHICTCVCVCMRAPVGAGLMGGGTCCGGAYTPAGHTVHLTSSISSSCPLGIPWGLTCVLCKRRGPPSQYSSG